MTLQIYKIASNTVASGGVTSIEFTSIPSGYTDLLIKTSMRTQRADYGDTVALTFNGSTTGYSYRNVYGYGTGAGSANSSAAYLNAARVDADLNTANTFSNTEIYIPNYVGSTNKSISIDTVYENNTSGNAYCQLIAGLWSNTAAITSVKFELDPNTLKYAQYTTITLYGIL